MTPDEFTNEERIIAVSGGHKLYTQDWGNPNCELPIISIHGGPGGSSSDSHKILFDPNLHRVIFFDQRGCGNSTPQFSLERNTTTALLDDIDAVAAAYKINRLVLSGNSWGSCLALLYALRSPDKVASMVLRGIFTASQAELDWTQTGQYRTFFPEAWESATAAVPGSEAWHPVAYLYEQIVKGGAAAEAAAAALNGIVPAAYSIDHRSMQSPAKTAEGYLLEAYYETNHFFIEEDYILKNAANLLMPIWLIQGQFDMICPPVTAYRLHQTLPNSELLWTMSAHATDRSTYDVTRTVLRQLYNGMSL